VTSLFFDIKRYAINDGPGIRITIFLKGCPLSCVWCHNPEGISPRKEILYTRKKCLQCQACVRVCPQGALSLDLKKGIITDREKCIVCGKCAEVCPSLAMEISGQSYSVDWLMKEIEKETLVMDQSGGGVTICGGEPLMHPVILKELLERCGDLDFHRAVDTTLYATPGVVRDISSYADLFLVDLKHMDSSKHQYYCGVPNELILSNLRFLAENKKDILIRIPLIEGVNADKENITESARFLSILPWGNKKVNLLPYHDIGYGKHEKLGTIYNPAHIPMKSPSDKTLKQTIAIFEEYGIKTTIGG